MTLDAALVFHPAKGWHLQPSPQLEQLVISEQTPPRFQEDHMTVAADLGTCTWASCREKATSSTREGWNFCPEHSAKDSELKEENDRILHRPAGQPIPRPQAPSRPLAPVPPPAAATFGSDAPLLQAARNHSVARVRNLADRIGKQLFELEALIAEHQATEVARKAQEAAKAKARADVARLEAELAAAKAKLRRPGSRPGSRPPSGANVHGDYPCRKTCGKTLTTAAARGNHEKHCAGTGGTT